MVEPAPDREEGVVAAPAGDFAGANGAAGQLAVARRTERVASPQHVTAAEPVAPPTDAARLATLSGGSLVDAPDGRASVVFPSAPQQPGRPARATRTAHRALPEPAPAAASIDVDELYDQIAARLRRELLLDRERAGEMP